MTKNNKTTKPKKAARKVRQKASVSAARKPRHEKAANERENAKNALMLELLKCGNVTILSKGASRRLIENTEFTGCIARPKNTTAS